MANTVTVDTKIIETILSKLDKLASDVEEVKKKLAENESSYGSDAWWDRSIKKGEEDIKAGRYTRVKNKKELQVFFDSLKD